jgi:hypothetical protein
MSQSVTLDRSDLEIDHRQMSTSIDDLQRTVDKLRRKKEDDKKSFQKRVKEFELILRYLEERVKMACGEADGSHRESTMQDLINEMTAKNATLESWLGAICQRLEKFSHDTYVARLREV